MEIALVNLVSGVMANKMEIIKKLTFVISLIVLLISIYEVFTIGWVAEIKFIFWSIIGAISFVIAFITYKSMP